MSTAVRVRKASETVKVRDVLYPSILEASTHIKDEFWRDFFVDLSKNKMNRKVHIDDKYVSHHGKKVSFNYCYHDKTPEEIAIELRQILSDTFSMTSETDEINEREELNSYFSQFKENSTEDDWKKVGNKKFKDHLITNYVLRLKEQHQLSNASTRNAYATINGALYTYRTHKPGDITMVDGQITSIDDITMVGQRLINERLKDLDESKKKVTVKKVNWMKEWNGVCESVVNQTLQLLCIEHDPKKKRKATPATAAVLASGVLASAAAKKVVSSAAATEDASEVAETMMQEIDELAELNTGFPDEEEEVEDEYEEDVSAELVDEDDSGAASDDNEDLDDDEMDDDDEML